MFSIKQIALIQFRNYLSVEFSFPEKVTGIYGKNGTGKTNLLDAIYYLCFTKSYFHKPDSVSVFEDKRGFRIEGQFNKDGKAEKLVCILRENNRKEFLRNDEAYKKFSEHIGKFPAVMIAPDDIKLITEGSEERRNFLDTLLSQLYPDYLMALIAYKKVIDQRNSFLKAASEKPYYDETLLSIIDEQLISHGKIIFTHRQKFLSKFLPEVEKEYYQMSGKAESVGLQYQSSLNDLEYETMIKENRQRDLFLQRTSSGVHKDDIAMFMKELPFKQIASQGQRKTLLFAIKLAEFAVLKNSKGFSPILLLDDVFEKLDAERMHQLLDRVCKNEDAQVFITDTHQQRLVDAFTALDIDYHLIGLQG